MGPFAVRLRVPFAPLVDSLHLLYADYPILEDEALVDLHVGLGPPNPLRRRVKPIVRFTIDARAPFPDSPAAHALPTLEWGINWGIATRARAGRRRIWGTRWRRSTTRICACCARWKSP